MASNSGNEESPIDLIGGPFAVIESDPGVFTSLTRRLGIKNVELVELYDIEPWAVDHLSPHGLIFCFHWRKDSHRPADFEDPAAERVWFANQLSDDACASQAILNVVLNCPTLDIGEELGAFKEETKEMSPVMKGLAVSNSRLIRQTHNSLARPADLRGSLNTISITTLEAHAALQKAEKQKAKSASAKQPPRKRARTNPKASQSKLKEVAAEDNENEETYHFIGYVPAHGKVWELDGLKSGPLEVGELPTHGTSSTSTEGWMDVARPALRLKMAKYGGGMEEGNDLNIRFSLLAIVDGCYEKANDEWQYWCRERRSIERRLDETNPGWKSQVDPELINASAHAFTIPRTTNTTFSPTFAFRRNDRDVQIFSMSYDVLLRAWEDAVRGAMRTKIEVEDELSKAKRDWADHVKRTHDYEPFFSTFVKCLHSEGLLGPLLESVSGRDRSSGKQQSKSNGLKGKGRGNNKQESKVAPSLEDELQYIEEDSPDEVEDDGDDEWKPGVTRR